MFAQAPFPDFASGNPGRLPQTLLPREGEKVADRPDEGVRCRIRSGAGDKRRDAPSSVDFVDTFSPSRGRRIRRR